MAWTMDPKTGMYVDDDDAGMPQPEKSGLLRRTVGDAATALAKGVFVGVPQAAVGLARLGTLGLADPLLNPVSDQLNSMGARIDKSYSPEHQQQAQEVANTKGFLPTVGAYLSRPGYLVDSAIEQLPTMYGGAKLGALATGGKTAVATAAGIGEDALRAYGTKAGAVGEGLVTAGQNVEQVDQQVRDETGQNSTLGQKVLTGMGGVVTGGISYGSGKLANKMGITDADALMAAGSRGKGGLSAKAFGEGVLTEGVLEELPQSMQEQMWQNAALGKNLMEGVPEAGAQGLVLGGAMGGGAQVLNNPSAQMAQDRQRLERVKDAQAATIALSSIAPNPDIDSTPPTTEQTKQWDTWLRAVADYSHSVAGEDAQVAADWRMSQLEALNKGGEVDFGGLKGFSTDEDVRTWAQNKSAEIAAREQAGSTDTYAPDAPAAPAPRALTEVEQAQLASLQKALQNPGLSDSARQFIEQKIAGLEAIPTSGAPVARGVETIPGQAARPLTAQEAAQKAQYDAALAAGDTETLAKLKGDIRTETPAQRAAARTAAPAAEAAPSGPKPIEEYVNPGNTIQDITKRSLTAHMKQFGGSSGMHTDTGLNAVFVHARAGNLAGVHDVIAHNITQYTPTADATPEQAEPLNKMKAKWEEIARVFNPYLGDDQQVPVGARDVQAENVSAGAAAVPANTESNASSAGAGAQVAPERDAAAKPVEEVQGAEGAVTPPVSNQQVDAKEGHDGQGQTTEVLGGAGEQVQEKPAPSAAYAVGDRISTQHNHVGTVTAVNPKTGTVTVQMEDGTPLNFTKKGQEQITKLPPAAQTAPAAQAEEAAPEDWESAFARLKNMADRMGLKIAGKSPKEQAAQVAKLANSIKDNADIPAGQRAEFRVAAEAALKLAAPQLQQLASREAKAKTAQDVASTTRALREGMSPEQKWDSIRSEAAGNYLPTWQEMKDFVAGVADAVKSLGGIKAETKQLKENLKKVDETVREAKRLLSAAEKDKQKVDRAGVRAVEAVKASPTEENRFELAQLNKLAKVKGAKVDEALRGVEVAQGAAAEVRAEIEQAEARVTEIRDAQTVADELSDVMELAATPGSTVMDTVGDLKAKVAYARLRPYTQMLEDLEKGRKEAVQREAMGARLLDLADKWWDNGKWLDKPNTDEFMKLYKQMFKKGAKDDFKAAMEHVSSKMLYRVAAGQTIPAIEVALRELSGKGTLNDLLGVIAKLAGGNEHFAGLARMIKALDMGGVKVAYANTLQGATTDAGMQAWKRGSYNAATNTVTVYRGGENAQIVLHEAVHAATVARLAQAARMATPRSQADAQLRKGYDQLVELYSALKAMPEMAGEYANKNVYEFVAEVFSNPKLQQKLALMPAPKGMFGVMGTAVNKLGSMLDFFIEAVRNVLGLKPGASNALTLAMELSAPFFSENAATHEGGEFDALSSPIGAISAVPEKLGRYANAVDKWTAKVNPISLKLKAYKVWLSAVSTDFIKDMVERVKGFGEFGERIGSWFKLDREGAQVRTMIAREVHDDYVRKLEKALAQSGDYAGNNAKMGRLANMASILGIDLTKNFEGNNADRKGAGKLKPELRDTVNKLHQEFKALERGEKTAPLAAAILQGQKINRKLNAMSFATIIREALEDFRTGDTDAAATALLNMFSKRLDVLDTAGGTTNPMSSMFPDALTYRLHSAIVDLKAELEGNGTGNWTPHAEVIDGMKELVNGYAKSWAAPYSHLGRHGQYHVRFTVKDPTPATTAAVQKILGDGYVVNPFTKGHAEAFLRMDDPVEMRRVEQALRASGLVGKSTLENGKTVDAIQHGMLSEIGLENMYGVSKAIQDLRRRMQERFNGLDTKAPGSAMKQAYDSMKEMMEQEFMEMLELNSARQVQQKRKNIAGSSSDYLRSFSKRAEWAQASIANTYTARRFTESFARMRDDISQIQYGNSKEAGELSSKAQMVYDELSTRFANSMKSSSNEFVHTLSAFGHIFYLALSPAYMIGNLTQPYVITLPMLGAKFGFVKSAKAMKNASVDSLKVVGAPIMAAINDMIAGKGNWRDVVSAPLDLSKSNMTADELGFIRHLIRSGIVDSTQTQELARLSRGESSTSATWARTLSSFSHYSEVMNRISTGLAAYRLSTGTTEARTDYAIDAVRRTQYDYAEHNKARIIGRNGLLGEYTPLVAQFQTFAFFTMEHYIRIFRDAMNPETRAEGLKALAGSLTTSALLTGAMGLPFATVAFALANAAGGDDKDARAQFREWLVQVCGGDKALAEMIAKGPVSRGLLGVDLTGSLGMQDLLPGSRMIADRREWKDKSKDLSKTLLGPALNAGFDLYGGLQHMEDGDFAEGIKAMLPRALKGPFEAARTADAGAFVNAKGQPLPIVPSSWDYAKMAGGWSPAKKAEQSEANFFYQSEMGQRKQNKSQAQRQIQGAMEKGDTAAAATMLQDWTLAHPGNPITSLQSSMRAALRGQMMAGVSGTGILDGNPKHLPVLDDYAYTNLGNE